MIEIFYTHERLCGEPGPNIYWRGPRNNFLELLNQFHFLGEEKNNAVNLSDIGIINFQGIASYTLSSKTDSAILAKVEQDNILMELDPKLWREILHKILSITFFPSFVYQEFDDREMLEQANIIMESV